MGVNAAQFLLCSGKRQLKTQACWEKATHGYSTPLKPVRRLFLWNASMEHVAATLLWHTFFGQSWILKGAKRSKSMGVPVSLYFYQPTTITSTVSFPLSNKHILSYFCIPLFINQKMGLSQNTVPQISRLIIIFPIKTIILEPNLNLFDNTNNI